MYKTGRITIFIIFFLWGFITAVSSDTVYLKNGRSIKKCLVKDEDKKGVNVEVGFGTIYLLNEEIAHIEKSSPAEVSILDQQWQENKKLQAEAAQKEELIPKDVVVSRIGEGMVVNVLINKKVKATLVLDTGASIILLSQKIGKELKLESPQDNNEAVSKVLMADGRQTEARLVVLKDVEVEGAQASDVGAAILLSENMRFDGLLGMSFLNKFHYQIDGVNKKLILKKLKP